MDAPIGGALRAPVPMVPRVLGFTAVLVVGWLVSSLLARGVTALLHAFRFDNLAERSVETVATLAKWLVRLVAAVVALDLLGLPPVSGVLQRLLAWLPALALVLVVLVIVGLALASRQGRPVDGRSRSAGLPERWGAPGPETGAEASVAEEEEEGRVRRSGYDRRRMAREGPDRRTRAGVAED